MNLSPNGFCLSVFIVYFGSSHRLPSCLFRAKLDECPPSYLGHVTSVDQSILLSCSFHQSDIEGGEINSREKNGNEFRRESDTARLLVESVTYSGPLFTLIHRKLTRLALTADRVSMSGFDNPGVFYSDSFGAAEGPADASGAKRSQVQKRFREFLRQFREGTDRTGFTYKYRYLSINQSHRSVHDH